MEAMKNVVIAGATGRMGRMLLEAVFRSPDMIVHSALERSGHEAIGRDIGEFIGEHLGLPIRDDMEQAIAGGDCLIDFTRPEATMAHLAVCVEQKIPMVIGTTALSEAQKDRLRAAADRIPIVYSPNMSVGVNVLYRVLSMAAEALGDDYDVEIIEAHHRHKVDSPSGTALKMGEEIARALGRNLADCAVYERSGVTGERDYRTIGFSAIRGGDIIGDHTALFAGVGERIEISHKSSSRSTYAEGSLRAVRFLADKRAGLYDMRDVLFSDGGGDIE